jgi:hypothetical protein
MHTLKEAAEIIGISVELLRQYNFKHRELFEPYIKKMPHQTIVQCITGQHKRVEIKLLVTDIEGLRQIVKTIKRNAVIKLTRMTVPELRELFS